MSDEEEHSELGPSGASGWRACPGKPNFERGRPDKSGREAAEGTVFHEYAALCLITGFDPHDFPEVTMEVNGYEITYDDDMRRYMLDGLDWIRDQLEPGDMLFVERRVDISPWCGPKQFGTGDVCIIKPAKRLIIIFDWKYGKGIAVNPEDNDQCYLYFLGFWHTLDLQTYFPDWQDNLVTVHFRIEQPRNEAGGGDWFTSVYACMLEGRKIQADAAATRNPDAPRIPGNKQCLFCKGSGECPEQAAWLLESYGQKFEDIQECIEYDLPPAFTNPRTLDLETRSWILLNWPAFKRFQKEIHALTLYDLRAGRDVPLLKAVEGNRGRRFFVPDYMDEVVEKLEAELGKDKIYETKMIGVPTAEKMLGKRRFKTEFGSWVDQPGSKPILVSLKDAREPIQDFASKFDDIEELDEDNDEED